jgi:dTDP-glucose 4,6-dehydratase
MSERIVVIGSNSFSGAHFIAALLDEGVHVVGVSRSEEPHPVFLPYKRCTQGKFTFHQLDLNENLDEIMGVIGDFMPNYVVNFACQSMVAQSWQHPDQWFQTNVVATVRFHDRLRRCDFVEKYVHISTPEVYGHCQGLIEESTHYNPSTPYAVSRAAADMSLMSFYRNYDFPVVFTRAANVYGPGQQLYRIIPRAILFFLTGRKLQLHGGGSSVRSFIHIRDVVAGTIRVMRHGNPPDIFHLSTTKNISIRSLVEMIAERLGSRFEDHVEMVDERAGKDAAYLLDSSKAAKELAWQPRVSLEDGIDETIAWVKDNLEILTKGPLDYIHKA